jgi:hypothetical protein
VTHGACEDCGCALHECECGAQPVLSDTQSEIRRVCDELCELLVQKNRAYGDSALTPMRVFSRADSVEQIKVRIDDKLSRLSRGHALPDESLDDTISDLMGYLVLLRVAVRRKGSR